MNDPSENPSPADDTEHAPLRVLVVDDHVASAKTMGWALELSGYDVRIAYDGAEALATALDHKPHAILLDLSLPGLDGYELCRIMQEEHGFSDTLFIAQTGWSEAEHRRRSKEAGFAHHMVKPVNMMKLEEILATYAGRPRGAVAAG
jgi:CheY-like chemotaxis protein